MQERLELTKQAVPAEPELAEDLEIALKFIEEEHATTIENVESLLAVTKITWDYLWALFPPNTLVYRHHQYTEQDQILKLRVMTKAQRQNKSWFWYLECDIVVDDGVKFGIAKEPLYIEVDEFRGARTIRDMSVIPLAYHEDENRLREEAVARGKRYVAIDKPCVMQTHGFAMAEDRKDYWKSFFFKFATHGRAIIDPAAFRTFNPSTNYAPQVHQTLSREELTDEQFMICTPVALGFSFGDKKWGKRL